MGKRVLLGMSGGVDSSVAAILLKQQGYEVIGATMKLWQGDAKEESSCCFAKVVDDAKKVCDILDIPHYTLNLKEEFQKHVITDFIQCYQCAKTPNPCVECNKYLKFGSFYQKAKELECEYIATGHYAKTEYSKKYDTYVLKKSNAIKKDQSYFLYCMPKEVISHILFPLQDFQDKSEIRKIATEKGLEIAQKKDSQEICFIPNNDYIEFLQQHMDKKLMSGNIRLITGEVLGKHKGIIYYTIGQRKGLGIAYKTPLYVLELDNKTNEVIVGPEEKLYQSILYVTDLNFLLDPTLLEKPIIVQAKIRYRAEASMATLTMEKDKVKVEFKTPQRAITPGQSVVFYLEDGTVLGGGKIHGTKSNT